MDRQMRTISRSGGIPMNIKSEEWTEIFAFFFFFVTPSI